MMSASDILGADKPWIVSFLQALGALWDVMIVVFLVVAPVIVGFALVWATLHRSRQAV